MVNWCPPFFLPGLLSDGHQAHADLVTGTMLLHHLRMQCKWQPLGMSLAFHLVTGVGTCALWCMHPTYIFYKRDAHCISWLIFVWPRVGTLSAPPHYP